MRWQQNIPAALGENIHDKFEIGPRIDSECRRPVIVRNESGETPKTHRVGIADANPMSREPERRDCLPSGKA